MCSFKGDDSMGKKSLIKSTTKKKADAKVEEEKTTKKAAAKKTKKTTTKSTKKTAAKTTKKSAAGTAKKSSATTAKKKTATAAKKPAAKKAAPKKTTAKKSTAKKATASKAKTKAAPKKAKTPKKVSVKELVFKKFEPVQALPKVAPAPKPSVVHASAPPIITATDSAEHDRLRTLLFNKFDMEAIKAAAKEPAPVAEPTTAPKPDPAKAAPETPSSADEPVDRAEEPAEPKPDDAYITVEPQGTDEPPDAMNRTVKIALAAAATVVFLMLAISYNNSSKYYIQPKDNAIEIWKGRFSPKDTQFFMVLHGTSVAEPIKATYTKNEVFPLVFDYYIDKADTLLEVPGLPDFEGIKAYLHQAEDYIVSTEMNAAVTRRLNTIERMILLYKADVAISKDTDDSLESAIKLLKKAGKLTPSTAQAEEITQKIERARERRVELKTAVE